jgi:hypothetical protein
MGANGRRAEQKVARLTISEAARITGVARSTLQRAVRAGRLSLAADHTVDTAELLRAGYTLHAAQQPQGAAALQDAAPRSRSVPQDAAEPPALDVALLKREVALLERERDLLRAALDAAAAREQVALEREAWLRHQLEQVLAQNQRLLEAPRPLPPAEASGAARRTPQAPGVLPETWQRILAYLREHPGPQRAQDVEQALGLKAPARFVCKRMTDAGLLARVAPGIYALRV